MADTKPQRPDRLPIKLILPRQGTEKRVPGGGTPPKPFRTVDAAYRQRLSHEVSAIREALMPQMEQTGAAPVRVKLLTKAAAKSHRPEHLFSNDTCPIVGAGKLGEIFVKATPEGLTRLTRAIEQSDAERIKKELSCVEAIETVTPVYRRRGAEAQEVLRRSPRSKKGFATRVRLFNFGDDDYQPRLVANFEEECRQRNLMISTAGYAPGSYVYGVECRSVDDVETLSRIVGVRSVTNMPLIRTLRQKMLNPKPLPKLVTRTDVAGDVPVVVVVDSGISHQIPELESWVVGRDSQVAPAYRNTDHGTFVAGLICWGSDLNPTVAGIDNSPCAVFDLQVIPNADPAKGDTDALQEQEFLISLQTALKQHANEYKVWNLSLGTDSVCSLDEFSEFAEQLDNLQEQYQVTFVGSSRIRVGDFRGSTRLKAAWILGYRRSA